MSARLSAATARRVLLQLRHDPRTVALMLVVPCLLMTLLRYVFDHQPDVFDQTGPMLLALFPFTVMFVIASVAVLRERSGGTLERLLASPIAKADLLGGYALAFGAAAVVQVGLVAALSVGPLGLHVRGDALLVVLFAVLDALMGMALGLFLSAFANSEFQAVQFLPAFVLPQLLLCGLFAPRRQMAPLLRWLSDAFPLSYAVDGATRAATSGSWSGALVTDLVVVCGCVPIALALGAATLRRRTA
jgi:ABC-2 type transport system permease protein